MSTWDMTKQHRTARLFIAFVLCLAALVAGTASASAMPATSDGKTKLTASLMDKKVKVNANARIKGKLDTETSDGRALEPIIIQKLVAGAWVNVSTTDCRPNYTFRLNISFSIAAEYSLRVYHPTTAVFSSTLFLAVVT
jgi:hypothetical protein